MSRLAAYHDLPDAPFQIFDGSGKAEDRHDFGSNRDVKARFARIAIGNAAQRTDDIAQRPVVHVHHPAPGHAPRVDAKLVAPIDVVVDHRREQIVGRGNGVEVAGEMQVDVFHRNDLRIAAARRTALHAKARTKRRFAQAHHGLLADAVEAIAQANRRCRLAFARRRRADRRHQNELAVLLG